MRIPLAGFLICVILAVCCPSALQGQVDAGALTAEEMLNRGAQALAARNFEQAEALLGGFLNEYGESPQAADALPRMLPLLATARIQLKKFPEALEVIRRFDELVPDPKPEIGEELLFWRGVCELHGGEHEASQRSFRAFLDTYRQSPKREEVVLLLAATAVVGGDFSAAADFLAETKKDLQPVNRGRATVLELHALSEAGRRDDAMRLIMEEFPNVADILQIVGFNTLALQLGSEFLEREEYRKAIACLQRVWPRDRLLRHQEARLEDLRIRLEAARQREADPFVALTLAQEVAKVEREVVEFRKVEHFDSALRLRLATAYLGMERYREAALIMEQMLEELPPDPIVEDATLNLNRCWVEIERWPKAIEACTAFEEKFPKSKHLPLVVFMRGMAEQNAGDYPASIATFTSVVEKSPDAEIAPRAFFMIGFSHLLADNTTEAIRIFEQFPGKYKGDDLEEAAFYWRGMGYSLAKEHETSREVMAAYLEAYPDGKYRGDATFRRAYSAQALADYDTAIAELRAFLDEFPQHASRGEALLLLGDALMGIGEIEKGIIAFKQIDPSETRFFEEGWFKVGKAFQLLEEHDQLRAHMERFAAEHPGSPRLPEAVYWIGWTHRQAGRDDEALRVYWDAIDAHGDSPQHRPVEDLFLALPKLYPGDEGRRALLARLAEMKEQAVAQEQHTLALRALWAQAKLWERREPARAILLLVEAAGFADEGTTSPQILADCGDALRVQNDPRAAEFYRGITRWNPRSPQKDRAFAGLGLLAMEAGREEEALDYFFKFEQQTLGSPLFGTVLMARARLNESRSEFDEAAAALEKLLEDERVPRAEKVEVLFQLGELMMARGKPELAVPYFQRVYVMYGRWPEFVAKSYLRSAEAFEKLDRTDEALRTYEEMTGREDLQNFAETTIARQRLQQLKGDT